MEGKFPIQVCSVDTRPPFWSKLLVRFFILCSFLAAWFFYYPNNSQKLKLFFVHGLNSLCRFPAFCMDKMLIPLYFYMSKNLYAQSNIIGIPSICCKIDRNKRLWGHYCPSLDGLNLHISMILSTLNLERSQDILIRLLLALFLGKQKRMKFGTSFYPKHK